MNSPRISLVVTEGPNEGDEIPVRCTPFIIGRLPDCPVRLGWQWRPAGDGIADRHCALVLHEGSFYLTTCKGADGTFVNGRRVAGAVELHDGEHLMIGEWKLRVQIVAAFEPPPDLPAFAPAASPPKISRPVGKQVILLGRKDRAMPLLRQREWEVAHGQTPGASLPPRRTNRWLQVAGVLGLALVLAGVSFWAGAAPPGTASSTSAPEPPRKQRPSAPLTAAATENRPSPRPENPPPRRRPPTSIPNP